MEHEWIAVLMKVEEYLRDEVGGDDGHDNADTLNEIRFFLIARREELP